MDWKKLDLKKATIFDLTDDPKIIHEEFGIPKSMSKEEYQNMPVQTRIMNLLDYARLTNNKELEAATNKAFETDLLAFGFE